MGAPPAPARGLPRVWARLTLLFPLCFAALAVLRPPLLEDHLENPLVDLRFQVRNRLARPTVPPGITIVAVDEKSLRAEGRWPWSRERVATLVEKIAGGGPRAIVVDLFFSEPESPAADGRLASVFSAQHGRLAEALVFEVRGGAGFAGEVPDLLLDQAVGRVEKASLLRPLEGTRALLPPEPIASSASFGHVNYLPDRNGKLRREYLYLRYGGEYLPALSLQAARLFLGVAPEKVRIVGGLGVDLGGRIVPTDDHGALLLNYYGPEGTFPALPATDVLAGRVPGEAFRDQLVILGATGVATYDMIVTPFSANMPGVEKNATAAANIVAGDFLRDAPLAADLLLVVAAGAAVFLLCRGRRAVQAFLALFLLTLLLLAVNMAAFAQGLRLALAYPLLLILIQGVATISQDYLAEERRAREMRRMFSSYVTERVVNELIANPGMARLGGARREVSILFSDIRGFTTFSERHRPEEVVAMLNEYFGAMTDVVFRWEGTLDKFIGDAVMAFWGAPLPQENHAERAMRCALHMQARLAELNAAWAAQGRTPLAIGIGINSGEVLVGNVGAEGKKMEYTVIGDQVNLTARLESLTKKYESGILITEHTLALIRPLLERGAFGHLTIRGLEKVAVKGKEEPVAVYALVAGKDGSGARLEDSIRGEVVRLTEK